MRRGAVGWGGAHRRDIWFRSFSMSFLRRRRTLFVTRDKLLAGTWEKRWCVSLVFLLLLPPFSSYSHCTLRLSSRGSSTLDCYFRPSFRSAFILAPVWVRTQIVSPQCRYRLLPRTQRNAAVNFMEMVSIIFPYTRDIAHLASRPSQLSPAVSRKQYV